MQWAFLGLHLRPRNVRERHGLARLVVLANTRHHVTIAVTGILEPMPAFPLPPTTGNGSHHHGGGRLSPQCGTQGLLVAALLRVHL